MTHSKIYLGAAPEHERAVRQVVGAELGRLHTMAQRVSWGILMGDRVGVNLDAEADRLRAEFGDQFAAHVTIALIRTFQGRHGDAQEHLGRARALVTPDHPWATLVPSEQLWAATNEPALEEVEPGRVYRVISENRSAANPFGNVGVTTFIRLRSGALVCINPVDMRALQPQLLALGDVTHIVAPAKYHSRYVPQAQELFPRARAFGVPGHRGYPEVAQVRFDGYLDDATPIAPGEIDQVTIRGVDLGDVWLIDRASRTLLVTDAVFFAQRTPENERFNSPFGAFYVWAWGIADRVGLPSYQPAMWQDLGAYQGSLRRALEHDFAYAGSCHGPWHALGGDARAELRQALDWLLGLGRLGGASHLFDFVRRHPGIFARLVREQIQQRMAKPQ